MGLSLCLEGGIPVPVIMRILLVLATVLLFWMPHIGIIWSHCPHADLGFARGLIKELRKAAERIIHENHHM